MVGSVTGEVREKLFALDALGPTRPCTLDDRAVACHDRDAPRRGVSLKERHNVVIGAPSRPGALDHDAPNARRAARNTIANEPHRLRPKAAGSDEPRQTLRVADGHLRRQDAGDMQDVVGVDNERHFYRIRTASQRRVILVHATIRASLNLRAQAP